MELSASAWESPCSSSLIFGNPRCMGGMSLRLASASSFDEIRKDSFPAIGTPCRKRSKSIIGASSRVSVLNSALKAAVSASSSRNPSKTLRCGDLLAGLLYGFFYSGLGLNSGLAVCHGNSLPATNAESFGQQVLNHRQSL